MPIYYRSVPLTDCVSTLWLYIIDEHLQLTGNTKSVEEKHSGYRLVIVSSGEAFVPDCVPFLPIPPLPTPSRTTHALSLTSITILIQSFIHLFIKNLMVLYRQVLVNPGE